MWWSTADIVRLGVWLTVGGYVVTAVGIGQNWRAGGASIKRLLDRLRSIERRDVTVETGVANAAATAYGATTVTGTAGGEWSLPGRVGRLEAQVRNLTGRVADLTGRAAGLTDKVERLEHENRTLREDVAGLAEALEDSKRATERQFREWLRSGVPIALLGVVLFCAGTVLTGFPAWVGHL